MYWSHEKTIPFTNCLPMFEPLVDHQEPLVLDSAVVELVHQKLSDNQVKRGLSVKVQDKDWFTRAERVLDSFS